ncbi:MAG: hypothetical protein Q9219_002165 [cf. Caloplaca sp. 3 TL-2023]
MAVATSSQTLPTLNQSSATPPQDHVNDGESSSPATPRRRLATSLGSPEKPSDSGETTRATDTAEQDAPDDNNALEQLPSAFESPRRLAFLEPATLPSTSRKTTYSRLSSGNRPEKSNVELCATSHAARRRRLRRHFLVSMVLLGLILAMYLLEGFAIAAAQRYAHVRLLSKTNGKGGLGSGKEDERWLIPWIIYIFLQGGAVIGCARMVVAMRRKVKLLDQQAMHENGKGVRTSNDDTESQGPDSRNTNPEGETEHSLLSNGNVFDDSCQEQSTTGDDEPEANDQGDEPESQAPDNQPALKSSKARATLPGTSSSSQSPRCTESDPKPHGEALSSGSFYFPGSYTSTAHAATLPITFLPEKIGSWWTEGSQAPSERQRKGSKSKVWSWESPEQKNDDDEDPTNETQTALLREEGSSAKNSWAQDRDREEAIDDEPEATAGRNKGKGKEEEEIELTKPVPREYLTGIDLGKEYHFSDGLAYPLLPTRRSAKSITSAPAAADDYYDNNGNDHDGGRLASPFSIRFPPSRGFIRSNSSSNRGYQLLPPPTGMPRANILAGRPPRTPTSPSHSNHSGETGFVVGGD